MGEYIKDFERNVKDNFFQAINSAENETRTSASKNVGSQPTSTGSPRDSNTARITRQGIELRGLSKRQATTVMRRKFRMKAYPKFWSLASPTLASARTSPPECAIIIVGPATFNSMDSFFFACAKYPFRKKLILSKFGLMGFPIFPLLGIHWQKSEILETLLMHGWLHAGGTGTGFVSS